MPLRKLGNKRKHACKRINLSWKWLVTAQGAGGREINCKKETKVFFNQGFILVNITRMDQLCELTSLSLQELIELISLSLLYHLT